MTSKKYKYITDGLVLHLDGEWNGGVGKHLAYTDTWVDLSPMGHNATTINGTKIAFGKDYSDQTSADAFISYVGLPAAKDLTIEVWFKYPSATSDFYKYVNCWNYNDDGTEVVTITLTPDYIQYWGGGGLNTGKPFYKHGAVTYNKTDQIFRLYSNGVETSNYSVNLTDGRKRIPVIGIGVRFQHNYYTNMKLYSLRVYNRTLSAEEIAYNTALDNKRLGR